MSLNLATILEESALAAPDSPALRFNESVTPTLTWTTSPDGSRPACSRPGQRPAT
ncbi:MAG: hypothetical protein ABI873_02440 [Marmoricola sp.]